jgi:8-oxo-dGTP pyrophosphatase MutT (NUDIX family)
MNYKVKTPFMELYEELSEINYMPIAKPLLEAFSSTPKQTAATVDLNTCQEIITSKFDPHVGAYETNCVAMVHDQLSRIEVRVFVLKREDGEVKFLGRKCNRSIGYTTPGGGYDLADKTPINTAKRELHEELGIALTNIQESTIHTFKQHGVRNGGGTWVRKYVENPEDRWTGYYQYYITAEYGGDSGNENPAEIGQYSWLPVSVFNDTSDNCGQLMLQIIDGHRWTNNDEDLDEAFDNEDVYGEAARTVPGVLRYFVPDIQTLNIILKSGQIKASKIKEADPNTLRGTKQRKRRPFVSFSHQLFSHAYRSSRWKFGVTVNEEKLKKSTTELDKHDGFKHDSRTVIVYGAAKLSDGTELLITSFGSFAMNLSDVQRQKLGNLPKTNFYEQVKRIFYELNAKNIEKCSEDLNIVCSAITNQLTADVVEGFVMTGNLRPSVGVKFKLIYDRVAGLHDYLQEHTPLDEGEFRVWLPDNQEFLDISSCITGIVLPSDYVESSFENPDCSDADTKLLRDYVASKGLEIYIYNSESIPKARRQRTRGPGNLVGGRWTAPADKPSLEKYFVTITSSRETAVEFIKSLANSKQARPDYSARYNSKMTTATLAKNVNEVAKSFSCNYRAFLTAVGNLGITANDVRQIIKKEAENYENASIASNDEKAV